MVQDTNRHDEIFKCIVESYVETAEPVGSRLVSKKYDGNLSPATIRNVMSDLEEMGLIHQPHTSAGRVPTDKGYRYYVDSFLKRRSEEESVEIPAAKEFLKKASNIEDAAERMSRMLADLTGNAGILYLKNVRRISYLGELNREMQKVIQELSRSNDRLYFDGTSQILEQPEFKSAERIRSLLRALELKEELAAIFEKDLSHRAINVHIGREVRCTDLSGISLVVREYSIESEPIGCLGVMGPTRMNYDKAIQIVNSLAETMTEFLNDAYDER